MIGGISVFVIIIFRVRNNKDLYFYIIITKNIYI